MSKRTVIVSDLTGEEIPEGELAVIKVETGSSSVLVEANKNEEVVQTLVGSGQVIKKRGRPKKGS